MPNFSAPPNPQDWTKLYTNNLINGSGGFAFNFNALNNNTSETPGAVTPTSENTNTSRFKTGIPEVDQITTSPFFTNLPAEQQPGLATSLLVSSLNKKQGDDYSWITDLAREERKASRQDVARNLEAQEKAYFGRLPFEQEKLKAEIAARMASAAFSRPPAPMPLMVFQRTPNDVAIPIAGITS